MVIDVLDVFLSNEKSAVLQRLPALFDIIVGRVKNHAMRVQMWVECA